MRLFCARSAFGLAAVIGVEVFAIRFGWIREWWPDVPQILITFVNPGTVLTLLYALYSIWVVRRYNSTRAGALAPVHLLPVRLRRAHHRRHLLPRPELGLLLVAGRLAGALR